MTDQRLVAFVDHLFRPPEEGECFHDDKRLTYRPDINGNPRFQQQCMDCGWPVGNFVAREVVAKTVQLSTLPRFDDTLLQRAHEIKRGARAALRADEKTKWWRWYNDYLYSEAWRAKTRLVHERAGHICEGCRSAPSAQVHHLTYEHVGDELLYELVAICRTCHEREHGDHGE